MVFTSNCKKKNIAEGKLETKIIIIGFLIIIIRQKERKKGIKKER